MGIVSGELMKTKKIWANNQLVSEKFIKTMQSDSSTCLRGMHGNRFSVLDRVFLEM